MSRLRPSLCRAAVAGALLVAPAGAAGPQIDAKVRSAYPQVLQMWAAGEGDAALEALEAMESSLVRPEKATRDVEEMWKSKLAVIRETIGRSSIEVLVPIMMLHHDAGGYYASQRKMRLATHSRTMAAELAHFYAKNSQEGTSKVLASDLLASLGGHLQQALVVRRSAALYSEALDLYPGQMAAHLGLAAMYERRGELGQAQHHYRESVRLAPELPEPRLRLALVTARMGERAEALEELELVLSMEIPDWMRRLALQERARRLAGDAGLEIAKGAAREYPDSSRQAILESFLLERRRRPTEALTALRALPQQAESESERYFYTRWPQQALEETRSRLREAAAKGRSVLLMANTAAVGGEATGQ